jgi:hypothetical protein
MNKQFMLLGLTLGLVVTSCKNESPADGKEVKAEVKQTITDIDTTNMVERGRYLVSAIGCEDCHSPKKLGPTGPQIIEELRFSGYPSDRPSAPIDKHNLAQGWVLLAGDLTSAVGPWGQSFAGNISSDETGIGNWTEEHFLVALKEGKSKGLPSGRPLLPPMPINAFKTMTDFDLKCIFRFLQTTKPVRNVVPAPIPPDQLK